MTTFDARERRVAKRMATDLRSKLAQALDLSDALYEECKGLDSVERLAINLVNTQVQAAIRALNDGAWELSGMTGLRVPPLTEVEVDRNAEPGHGYWEAGDYHGHESSSLGQCSRCDSPAVVGLNGQSLCLSCYDNDMKKIGQMTRRVVQNLASQVAAGMYDSPNP